MSNSNPEFSFPVGIDYLRINCYDAIKFNNKLKEKK